MRPSSPWASALDQELLTFPKVSFRTRILGWLEVLPTPCWSKVVLLSPGPGFLFSHMHLVNHMVLGRETLRSADYSFLPRFKLPSCPFAPFPHPLSASPLHSPGLPERILVLSQLNPH